MTLLPELLLQRARIVWLAYALALAAIALVGATNPWLEGSQPVLWRPIVNETTSVFVIFCLTPGIVALTNQANSGRVGWLYVAVAHTLGLVTFCTLHVSGMILLRKIICPLFGGIYQEETHWFVDVLIYEGRKDALTYVALVTLTSLLAQLARRSSTLSAEAIPIASNDRIPYSNGPLKAWINADEILHVEAAGNYVELVLASKTLLQRASLRDMESMLKSKNFVRIHRSRIVNISHVISITNKNNRDFTLAMSNGRKIQGSRRWRKTVMTALELLS